MATMHTKGTAVTNAKALVMGNGKTYAAGELAGVVETSRVENGTPSYLVTWSANGQPILRNTRSTDRMFTRWASASWLVAR